MGCVNQKDGGSNIVCRAKHFHFEVRVLSVDALAARTRPKWPNSADKRSLGERTGRTRTSPTRLRSAVPGSHSHTLRRSMFIWLTALFRKLWRRPIIILLALVLRRVFSSMKALPDRAMAQSILTSMKGT